MISCSTSSLQADGVEPASSPWGLATPLLALLALWVGSVLLVDPVGEFPINDDWSYIGSLEVLTQEGRLISTGWAGGGISLISHLLWGGLFASLFGPSITVLRISVLVMGFLGIGALLTLLRSLGASRNLSLLGALLLGFNPLFFSQSFTFMTDVTFTSLAVMALLTLHQGVRRRSPVVIACGLLLCLASVLTRQLGLAIALGFMAALWWHPLGRELGRVRCTVLTIVLTIVPWLAWEYTLATLGSTPVTQHQLISRFTELIASHDGGRYFDQLIMLLDRLAVAGVGLVTFLLMPLLVMLIPPRWATLPIKRGLLVYAVACLVLEVLVLTGILESPAALFRSHLEVMGLGNVLLNFGIGPLLFKDTYLLGMATLSPLPDFIWDLLGFAVLPLSLFMLSQMPGSLKRNAPPTSGNFTGQMCLLSAVIYLAVLVAFGFHDRYLILLVVLLMVWLISAKIAKAAVCRSPIRLVLAVALLGFFMVWSIGGTHDLMATERAAQKARMHAVTELAVDPCHIDGGFAWGGQHCHNPSFEPRPGLSWWWVSKEKYLVALHPLNGYQVVKSSPFTRWLGKNGTAFLLKPK